MDTIRRVAFTRCVNGLNGRVGEQCRYQMIWESDSEDRQANSAQKKQTRPHDGGSDIIRFIFLLTFPKFPFNIQGRHNYNPISLQLISISLSNKPNLTSRITLLSNIQKNQLNLSLSKADSFLHIYYLPTNVSTTQMSLIGHNAKFT